MKRILNPPIMIGEKLYRPGHGNRKTPEEWKVYYLGWNGEFWEISLSRYEGSSFVQSLRIMEGDIDAGLFFRDYNECAEVIKQRKIEIEQEEGTEDERQK